VPIEGSFLDCRQGQKWLVSIVNGEEVIRRILAICRRCGPKGHLARGAEDRAGGGL